MIPFPGVVDQGMAGSPHPPKDRVTHMVMGVFVSGSDAVAFPTRGSLSGIGRDCEITESCTSNDCPGKVGWPKIFSPDQVRQLWQSAGYRSIFIRYAWSKGILD